MEIGTLIASRRKELGMTQEQLAEKLNMSAKVISKWETGRSLPDTSVLTQLCAALEMTLDELLGSEERPTVFKPRQLSARTDFKLANIVYAASLTCTFFLFLGAMALAMFSPPAAVVFFIFMALVFVVGCCVFAALRIKPSECRSLKEDKKNVLFAVLLSMGIWLLCCIGGAIMTPDTHAITFLSLTPVIVAVHAGVLIWNKKRK